MKNYKRLTFKIPVDPYNDDCEETENAAAASYDELLNRLAKLEDKIENGTLVTVPYSIGQELYCVYNKSYKVEKVKVSLITIRHDGGIDIRLNHYYKDGSYCGCFKYDSKYYELFKTETEALKKFEELKRNT